jgi:Ca2+-binding RTX toxin-like protein
VDDAGDVVTENASEGTDLVQSGVSFTLGANVDNLTLTGSSGINGTGNDDANTITGNSGVNTLTGGGGNDTLDGGTGADTMTGGAADDTFIVDNAGDAVTENASEGTDLVKSAVSFTLGSNIENLTLTGSGNINGTGNSLDNVLAGNAGTNTLTGGLGNDIYFVSAGDVIVENSGEGTDIAYADSTYTLSANVENLTMIDAGQHGTGNSSDNTINGNTFVNILSGAGGNDTLYGLGGNDTLDGGTGADTMGGGTGNDLYKVDDAGDVVTENSGEGTDTVQSAISYTLTDNVEHLTLTGSSNINGTGNALANSLTGNSGANVLSGGDGNDVLSGSGGNDTLDGGAGTDSMTGGSGADIFAFMTASYGTNDTVTDFSTGAGDVLDIRDILIGYSGSVTDWVRITDDSGNSKVEVDRDGTGGTYGWSQIATLTGVTGLTDEATLVSNGNLLVA